MNDAATGAPIDMENPHHTTPTRPWWWTARQRAQYVTASVASLLSSRLSACMRWCGDRLRLAVGGKRFARCISWSTVNAPIIAVAIMCLLLLGVLLSPQNEGGLGTPSGGDLLRRQAELVQFVPELEIAEIRDAMLAASAETGRSCLHAKEHGANWRMALLDRNDFVFDFSTSPLEAATRSHAQHRSLHCPGETESSDFYDRVLLMQAGRHDRYLSPPLSYCAQHMERISRGYDRRCK